MGGEKAKERRGVSHTFGRGEINLTYPSHFFKDILEQPAVMRGLLEKKKHEIFMIAREEIMRRRKSGERKNIHGHHINESGLFQSDKYPDLKPDKIILSFHDPDARLALLLFSAITKDRELGEDILQRLLAINTKRRNKSMWEKAD